jgi:hypothetical protein
VSLITIHGMIWRLVCYRWADLATEVASASGELSDHSSTISVLHPTHLDPLQCTVWYYVSGAQKLGCSFYGVEVSSWSFDYTHY